MPEPVDTSADPYLGAERGGALEYAAPRIARRVVVGALQVAKFLHAMSWFWDGAQLDWVTTNGQAAVLVRHGDTMSGGPTRRRGQVRRRHKAPFCPVIACDRLEARTA